MELETVKAGTVHQILPVVAGQMLGKGNFL